MEATQIQSTLAQLLGKDVETPIEKLFDEVKQLKVSEGLRNANAEFQSRIDALMQASHMTHAMARETLVMQDAEAKRQKEEEERREAVRSGRPATAAKQQQQQKPEK